MIREFIFDCISIWIFFLEVFNLKLVVNCLINWIILKVEKFIGIVGWCILVYLNKLFIKDFICFVLI